MGFSGKVLSVVFYLLSVNTVLADVIIAGDVSPLPASAWSSTTHVIVGNSAVGSVAVNNASVVSTYETSIGDLAGANGMVNITGAGTAWSVSGGFDVGLSGAGVLNISNGASVSGLAGIGQNMGSTGLLKLDGIGSIFSGQLYLGASGNGSVIVSNGATLHSLVNGYQVTDVGSSSGSYGSANISGAGSEWDDYNGALDVGYLGSGAIVISQGATFKSESTSIGAGSGSSGTVNITGAGSRWINSGGVTVGYDPATGNNPAYARSLRITQAGAVSDMNATIDQGFVDVDGPGSSWTNTGTLSVGNNYVNAPANELANLEISGGATVTSVTGDVISTPGIGNIDVAGVGSTWVNSGVLHLAGGVLNITGGGNVTAGSLSASYGTIAIDIGDGSSLNLGQSTYSNPGVTSFRAMPQLAAGTYAGNPILGGSASTFGTIQAIGGIWNNANQSFVVTSAATGVSGKSLSFSLLSTQRMLVTGSAGQSVGASFLQGTSSGSSTITATMLTVLQTQSLNNALPSNEYVAGGWGFADTLVGYPSNSPVYLSMQIGSGYSASEIELWYSTGTTWNPYYPRDLSYDGNNVNFSVTNFGGYEYAVSIPEPAICNMAEMCLALIYLVRPVRPVGRFARR